jgi:hypothetical protein
VYCVILTGLRKKLESASKLKDCELIGQWTKSMINHVYWSVMSSNDDSDLIEEKWLSLANHVHNKHDGHGKRYMKCKHGRLKRKWIKWVKIKLHILNLLPVYTGGLLHGGTQNYSLIYGKTH